MSPWSEAVEFAIKRSASKDVGAQAAIQGILGLPLSFAGKTAIRCYNAASEKRQALQNARERRQKPLLTPGTTGNDQWDKQLLAHKTS